MFYVIWFEESSPATPSAAFTSNPEFARQYMIKMSKLLNAPGKYEVVRTMREVRDILTSRAGVNPCDASLNGSIEMYKIELRESSTRPRYALMTEAYYQYCDEWLDYNGGPDVYTMSKIVSRILQVMTIMAKKTPTMKKILDGVTRISQYLYAYGIVEEHLTAIVEGDYDEGEADVIMDAINEVNIPLYEVVDTVSGFFLIDIFEYINWMGYIGDLFIGGD